MFVDSAVVAGAIVSTLPLAMAAAADVSSGTRSCAPSSRCADGRPNSNTQSGNGCIGEALRSHRIYGTGAESGDAAVLSYSEWLLAVGSVANSL